MSTVLLWLRRDLRLSDHPALVAALFGAEVVVPVFCFDPRLLRGRNASGPRTQFLLDSLNDLNRSLCERGSRLITCHGLPETEIPRLVEQLGATAVHATADVGPLPRRRDERVRRALSGAGVPLHLHPGLFVADDPASILTGSGRPYRMFTPYYRAWTQKPRRAPLRAPATLPGVAAQVPSDGIPKLDQLGLTQELVDPALGGERAGRRRMEEFLRDGIGDYGNGQNDLGRDGSSVLSPYLHFGCVSARDLEARLSGRGGALAYRRQLCWRDFYAQLLRTHPENVGTEYQQRYRGVIGWSDDDEAFEAWCEGRTGFPLIDAAMRQLLREGWMHNRGRLLVGSFLTKDLGIDWRRGERWFMRLLIDGDEANNNGNWQWIASVGVDRQPVTRRIYNPTRQQAQFDPDGRYVRRYVPQLGAVPARYLGEPWTMPDAVQREAGCVIGRDYPAPIVDHAQARREAIARYQAALAQPVGRKSSGSSTNTSTAMSGSR